MSDASQEGEHAEWRLIIYLKLIFLTGPDLGYLNTYEVRFVVKAHGICIRNDRNSYWPPQKAGKQSQDG